MNSRQNRFFTLASVAVLAGALGTAGTADGDRAAPHRVYSHLLDPREHPDYDRRPVKPPAWDTFGGRTQFTCLRGFNVQDDRIVGYAEEIERFTRTHDLGTVIWPSYPILFAKNLGDLAEEIKRRDLYLFDVWGYVPGSGPGGYWQQFKPPAEAFTLLEAKLGERWLGTDIGEQDGRYIGGYANQMHPASANRFEQYLNSQRHFERMGDDLGHKHAALVSLNFGHYFLKEGTYTLIGAETAQALPNNQVYYAFIRGAGKQYGVPWFGNASVFNRWGYKTYGSEGTADGYQHGPTKGTSLSLLKRLLYSHILYNSMVVGFENGWLEGDKLTPIGRIQQSAQQWVREQGQPGVMHTPVALLLDFYAGWSFPRHLYTDKLYRVWGNLPYEPGDYLTDGILDLLYPGYQNSSYYHDESGFVAPTPYGDIADCLLSDAPLWLLKRYPVVIVAGELKASRELFAKLWTYAREGGHLVITGENLRRLDQSQAHPDAAKPNSPAVTTAYGHQLDELPFTAFAGWSEPAGEVLAKQGRLTLADTRPLGEGRITVFRTPFGVTSQPQWAKPLSEIDKPLITPYPLLRHVRAVLDHILRAQMLFEAGDGLSLITCRKGPGDYTLGIFNNSWRELPFKITSRAGPLQSISELPLDCSAQSAPGYTPEGIDPLALGRNTASTIAGGDVRIFALRVKETGVVEIAQAKPPTRPLGRVLPLRRATSIKEEILARPCFFQHFDGVVVDWRYLHEREQAALAQEARWLRRQGLRVYVDLSSGVNLYPDLRLANNLAADYAASMDAITDVLAKMEIVGARQLVLPLHRAPENNFTDEQTRAAFAETLRGLARQAAQRQVTLHLRVGFGKPPWSVEEAARLLELVGAPNLRLAPATALLMAKGAKPESLAPVLAAKTGLWLVSAPRRDLAGQLWDAHGPIHCQADAASARQWLALAPNAPVLLDAVYADQDEEYLDATALW
jgi:hypothetical protein